MNEADPLSKFQLNINAPSSCSPTPLARGAFTC